MVCVEAVVPGVDGVEAVAGATKARGNVFVLGASGEIWASGRHGLFDGSCLVKPLIHVGLLVPAGWSDGALGRSFVQIWLVTKFPVGKLTAFEGFANQRHRCKQRIVAYRAILGQVEAMGEGRIWPCRVGVEVRWANEKRGRIIRALVVVEDAVLWQWGKLAL